MIFEAILNMFTTLIQTFFSVLPSLPEAPPELTTASDAILSYAGSGVYFLRYLFSDVLLGICLSVFVAVLVYERGHSTIMYVLKKIPFINIK